MKKNCKINFNKFIDNINSIESNNSEGGEGEEQLSKEEWNELIYNCCLILNDKLDVNENLLNYFTKERLDRFEDFIYDWDYSSDFEKQLEKIGVKLEQGYSLKDMLFNIKSTVVPNSILFF